jgi:hypothetical protein
MRNEWEGRSEEGRNRVLDAGAETWKMQIQYDKIEKRKEMRD